MYKKLGVLVLLSAVLVLPATARPRMVVGNGQYVSHDMMEVAPFSKLVVNGQTEVEFWQTEDESYQMSVSGPENLVELVEVNSQDGALTIRYKEPLLVMGDHHLRVAVMAPKIERVEVHEAGEVKFTGPLAVADLTVLADGKGEIDFDAVQAGAVRVEVQGDAEVDFTALTCQALHVDATQTATFDAQRTDCNSVSVKASNRANVSISGLNGQNIVAESWHSSEMELKGKVSSATLTARGRSELDAGSLQAENADVMAESSARIDVRVSDTLNAQTQGRGVVEYKGWPKQINRSGKGTVKQDK